MATLASWNPNKLFCVVRKTWVKATPEERVRQRWLTWMVEKGGYPLALLAVEKELSSLASLFSKSEKRIPDRRADLIAFTPSFNPLLIVECKASGLNQKAIDQIKAYNGVIFAPFLALVDEKEAMTAMYDQKIGGYLFSPGFYPYPLLVERIEQKIETISPQSSRR